MKYLLITTFLLSNLCFGQFFEDLNNESSSDQQFQNSDTPDQGLDNDGEIDPNPNDEQDPDPIPINQWAFLLPLAGLVVGGFYFNRKRLIN